MLQEIINSIPENWHWQLIQPPEKKKKKKVAQRYTVYISNGEMIGTKHYASVHIDGNDLVDTLQEAIHQIKTLDAEKRQKNGKN